MFDGSLDEDESLTDETFAYDDFLFILSNLYYGSEFYEEDMA